ncbi:F-box only protein 28 isoform X6 [Agrilus planipennis]|uniref:F-box only protein 28 isoform X6 n=1 Tax=Agrilus planipennis TaxID=224129 RepID=A0A1W4XLB5_AGRPL|nr:F-box only protein 28 isoform X6 [Agrilus planipennis]
MCAAVSLLNLPNVALEKIFSFLSYDEIAKNRIVCRKFNQTCSQMLTRGFYQMEKRHSGIYKKLKSLLPRRESERRNHPLARHCDILSAVETRISMLNMTFIKYIETNKCCFIPGKILDEIDRILRLIESTGSAPRSHEFLQELRDISSMAMEHFDEHILPTFKSHIDSPPVLPVGEQCSSRQPLLILNKLVTDEMRKIRRQNKSNKQTTVLMRQQIVKLFQKIKTQNSRIKAQTNKLKEQEKKIQEQTVKIQETEAVIGEMKRHMGEWEEKFSDLTADLVRAREELVAKSRLSPIPPSHPISTTVPTSRSYTGHILPRTGLPRTPTILLHHGDRKRKSPEGVETPPCKLPKNISKDICDKISKNITNNISKNVTGSMMKEKDLNAGKKQSSQPFSFLSSSLETLLKRPLTSITGRKRKIHNDIELK